MAIHTRNRRRRVRWGVVAVVAVVVLVLAATGCARAAAYLQLPPDERRLFDVYSAFMTPAQQAAYLSAPGPEARRQYAEALGVARRLAALPEQERAAVLDGTISRGFSAEALLMAWGSPYLRTPIGGGDERWVYLPYYSRQLPPSAAVEVYLRDGRVRDWAYFVIPVPERP